MITGKRLALIALLATVTLMIRGAVVGLPSSATTSRHALVCIDRFMQINVLDQALAGIWSELPRKGWTEGVNLTYDIRNAQGYAAKNQAIAKAMVNEKCSVLVGLATQGASAFQALTRTIPIVFVASSTPVESRLVSSLGHPGANLTGVADIPPIVQGIEAMRKIKPGIRTIGLVFTSGDAASEGNAQVARDYLRAEGLQSVDAPIVSAADAVQRTQTLVNHVDAIGLPCDPSVLPALDSIMGVANQAKVPVFGCTADAVRAGAILAGAYDYRQIGVLAADVVAQILAGANPADIPVVIPPLAGYQFNVTTAKGDGLTIPPDLISKAVRFPPPEMIL